MNDPEGGPLGSTAGSADSVENQSLHHSRTFPCMSWKPQALGFFAPASCVTLSLFCSYQAMSARTPLPATGASLPARQSVTGSHVRLRSCSPP